MRSRCILYLRHDRECVPRAMGLDLHLSQEPRFYSSFPERSEAGRRPPVPVHVEPSELRADAEWPNVQDGAIRHKQALEMCAAGKRGHRLESLASHEQQYLKTPTRF